jgi:biopolymer transport protein ExbD
MKARARKKVDATFNMSSMTDIVFLLLIFFIVLSTFVTPPGIGVDLPNTKNSTKDTSVPKIVVSIDLDGNYYLDKVKMAYEILLSNLGSKVFPGGKKPTIKLEADGGIPLEKGVSLFADIKNLGYKKVVIATEISTN